MDFPHLKNAPIAEAIVDLRVELPPDVTVETLKKVGDIVSADYPERRTRISGTAALDLQTNTITSDSKPVGYLFWSTDRRQALQARLDGFSVSRLKPYQDWKTLRAEACARWEQFVEVAHPLRITRVALRYLNRIELPKPFTFEEYLKTFPHLGEDLPQAISGLFCRVVLQHSEATAIVTQAIDEQGVTDAVVPLLLDIDVFQQVEFEIQSDDPWKRLDILRQIKNEMFFGSITQRARELFE
jgi:uncharacterized protein (TIGR04255 family)